jgi:hypothetical protein
VARLSALAIATPLLAGRADASTNPANNYYFPMAKYRYLPRISRAYNSLVNATDELARAGQDWPALSREFDNADDATTALALYANSVEGSRSSKGKKKTPRQKKLYACADRYKTGVEKMGKAVKKQSAADAGSAVLAARQALEEYQEIADIVGEKGACSALARGLDVPSTMDAPPPEPRTGWMGWPGVSACRAPAQCGDSMGTHFPLAPAGQS